MLRCSAFLLRLCSFLQNTFTNATQGFSLFSSMGYGQPDVMFSDSTVKLMRVMGTYRSWLGHSYTTMLQAFECEGKNSVCTLNNWVRLSCHVMRWFRVWIVNDSGIEIMYLSAMPKWPMCTSEKLDKTQRHVSADMMQQSCANLNIRALWRCLFNIWLMEGVSSVRNKAVAEEADETANVYSDEHKSNFIVGN